MLGLFGSLNLGVRSLQAQQMGVEVAGHNLANVNNPDYSRQRINLDTALSLPTALGPQGTGVEVVAIQQLRNVLLDHQLQSEVSVTGYFEAQQQALQYAQANLGEEIDRRASGAEGAASAGSAGQAGLANGLNALFNSFQGLSANPTSLSERQALVLKAQTLASQFNQASRRLSELHDSLNNSVSSDVADANQLIDTIAKLNDQIRNVENTTGGTANDLRDERAARIEALAKLVKIDATDAANGTVSIAIAGTAIIDGSNVLDTLETYDAGGGRWLVRTVTGATPLTLTGGHMQGTIQARDTALASLRTDLDTLASQIVTRVNTIHSAGYSLTGTTGANFFTGTNASNMAVNTTLLNDFSLIQASGVAGAVGDNQTALALAQLGRQKLAVLGNQTFSERFGQTVAALGQSLAAANGEVATQDTVESLLRRQRDSVMGVSLDEEMTDLVKFQKAYQASARLITTIDEMLETIMNLKR